MELTKEGKKKHDSFLVDYYAGMIKFTGAICDAALVQDEERAAFKIAVFEKIARPSFYLKDEFNEYLALDHTVEDETQRAPQKTSSKISQPPGTIDVSVLLKVPWKGRKLSDNPAKYEVVILGETKDYGWEFTKLIPPKIIELLKGGPLHMEGFQFKLSEDGRLVQASKRKAKQWKNPR